MVKKTYKSPKALIVELQINNSLLLSTSETQVLGANGGWVKEEASNSNPTITDKSLWDEEW